jgi:hypothetical protein
LLGQRGTMTLALQPCLLSFSFKHTGSSRKAILYGTTSLKNIKYKTLPYSISNHSIYKFIILKKSKRYSNSTQFKFFFSSSLKVPNGIPEAGNTGAMLPSKRLLGNITV